MKHFETCDLTLAGALLALGHTLADVDRRDPNRVVFKIEPEPDVQTLADFAAARLMVNVCAYALAVRRLSDAIHEGRRYG